MGIFCPGVTGGTGFVLGAGRGRSVPRWWEYPGASSCFRRWVRAGRSQRSVKTGNVKTACPEPPSPPACTDPACLCPQFFQLICSLGAWRTSSRGVLLHDRGVEESVPRAALAPSSTSSVIPYRCPGSTPLSGFVSGAKPWGLSPSAGWHAGGDVLACRGVAVWGPCRDPTSAEPLGLGEQDHGRAGNSLGTRRGLGAAGSVPGPGAGVGRGACRSLGSVAAVAPGLALPAGTAFTSASLPPQVMQVLNADAIVVKLNSGDHKTIHLSSIRPPRLEGDSTQVTGGTRGGGAAVG